MRRLGRLVRPIGRLGRLGRGRGRGARAWTLPVRPVGFGAALFLGASLFLSASPIAQAAPAAPQATAPVQAAAPAPQAQSAARLEALRAELRAAKGQVGFASLLEARAGAAQPADAAALLSEFAPLVADPAASKALMLRGASLCLLLGRLPEAAALYEGAAFRPGLPRDEALLLKAARLRLAAGEAERAAEIAGIVQGGTKVEELLREARLVSAWAALLSGAQDRAAALAAEVAKGAPAGSAARREARFLAWAAANESGRPEAARLLASEYPGSPEARIAVGQAPGAAGASPPKGQAASVELSPLPHWYLSGVLAGPGLDRPAPGSLAEPQAGAAGSQPAAAVQGSQPPGAAKPAASAPDAAATPGTAAAKPAAPAAALSPAAATPAPAAPAAGSTPAPAAAAAPSAPTAYQVGVFSKPENAARLLEELKAKGFKARTEKRISGGRELVAVVVEGYSGAKGSPADGEGLLLRLKDSGYEAYPLF